MNCSFHPAYRQKLTFLPSFPGLYLFLHQFSLFFLFCSFQSWYNTTLLFHLLIPATNTDNFDFPTPHFRTSDPCSLQKYTLFYSKSALPWLSVSLRAHHTQSYWKKGYRSINLSTKATCQELVSFLYETFVLYLISAKMYEGLFWQLVSSSWKSFVCISNFKLRWVCLVKDAGPLDIWWGGWVITKIIWARLKH